MPLRYPWRVIALQVTHNGKYICTAGAEDLCVLDVNITALGSLGKKTVPVRSNEMPDLYYMVGGLTSRSDPAKDVHLRWKSSAPLKIGDVVEIKIVETTRVDRPKSRTKAKRRNT